MRITETYKPDELPRLCQLNDLCFTGLERPPHEDFKSMLLVSENWFAREEWNDAQIVGYIIVQRNYGAYLWQIAVDPDYRGRGFATCLMDRAENWCQDKGDKNIRLHCDSDNPSQKLYFNRGYRTYDLAYNYYGEKTIALMMKKELNGRI